MSHYVYNPDTMLYEEHQEPPRRRIFRIGSLVLTGLACTCLYFWLFTNVFGWESPKTVMLRRRHIEWEAKMEILNRQLDLYDQTLSGIEDRDDDVYRSIYGLAEIPVEIRNAGFGGVDRYGYLDQFGASDDLKAAVRRIDVLTKRTYVQSKALDEVGQLSKQAGDMLSCVPSVPPLLPDRRKVRLSSGYGGRSDPVYGGREYHQGQDFAVNRGYPVYATGDGVVEKAESKFSGYGNEIVINHGYGYRTRYAHLSTMEVSEGMKVQRGQRIGAVGSTGKSTGPHLHYEVEYMKRKVNPMRYMDFQMPLDEYRALTEIRNAELAINKKPSTTDLLRRRRKSDE